MKAYAEKALRGLVLVYRYAVSPLLGPGKCRYDPTCSAYALEALRRYGALRGGWLALRRLSSCHGWSRRPFHDPVPSAIKTGHRTPGPSGPV